MRLEDSWKDRKGREVQVGKQAGRRFFFFGWGVVHLVNPGCGARGQCQGAIGLYRLLALGPWGSS